MLVDDVRRSFMTDEAFLAKLVRREGRKRRYAWDKVGARSAERGAIWWNPGERRARHRHCEPES